MVISLNKATSSSTALIPYSSKEATLEAPSVETRVNNVSKSALKAENQYLNTYKAIHLGGPETPESRMVRSAAASLFPSVCTISGGKNAVETGIMRTIPVRGGPVQSTTIEQRMRELNVPGASIAVINNGEIEWSSGYGELNKPVLIQAASISKTIAALTVLSLVEQGKIQLDTDVSTLLDPTLWKSIDPNGLAVGDYKMTIRQLLSHSAGTTVSGFMGYHSDQEIPTLDDILTGKGNSDPVTVAKKPGTEFNYSGGGSSILQKVIEVIIPGKTFEQVVEENVFVKLGMSDSTYHPTKVPPSHGHTSDGSVIPGGWNIYPELAAAGLWTTPMDLAKMARGIQKALTGENKSIIGPELANEMISPQVKNNPNSPGVGLGVFIAESNSTTYFFHGGTNIGFQCFFISNTNGQGAVVMTNSDSGRDLYNEIIPAIAKVYNWPEANNLPGFPSLLSSSELKAMEKPIDLNKWKLAEGTYKFETPEETYEVGISSKEEKMFVNLKEGEFELVLLTENIAAYKSPWGAEVVRFQKTEDSFTSLKVFGDDYSKVDPSPSLRFPK